MIDYLPLAPKSVACTTHEHLHRRLRFFKRRRLVKPVLAGVLAALFLFAATLAGNPSLHEELHPDSDARSQFCLVCTFAAGLLETPEAALIKVFVAFVLVCRVFSTQAFLLPRFDFLLLPGRAPPRA